MDNSRAHEPNTEIQTSKKEIRIWGLSFIT
jgi:hypothetical protein